MYQRFINGIEQGMSPKSLVDPADKNFIGKDILSFMLNQTKYLRI
jgi:hypothetical protein